MKAVEFFCPTVSKVRNKLLPQLSNHCSSETSSQDTPQMSLIKKGSSLSFQSEQLNGGNLKVWDRHIGICTCHDTCQSGTRCRVASWITSHRPLTVYSQTAVPGHPFLTHHTRYILLSCMSRQALHQAFKAWDWSDTRVQIN